MRIALLTYSTRPRGGVVHTLELAEALAAQGAEVTVWSLARGGGFFRTVDERVEVRLVDFPERDGEAVGPRILRSIDALAEAFEPGYDIVHAQDCISANAVLRRGGSVIRTVHHIDHFTTPELAACHERALTGPGAHVCVSTAVADQLRRGWGIGARVIANGVDSARFEHADGRRWRERYGPYVLAVGGIEPRKGTLDLVRAMAQLQQRAHGVELVVAGGETLFDYRDYRHTVDAEADRLGVDPVVLGQVDHDRLPSLMAGAGVLCFPSTNEGFGLAAMEALAAGVPVVTRDLPVFREVFGDAVRYGTDPRSFADAMFAAITSRDPARCARGRELARRHTWERAAREHLAFYREQTSGVANG